MTLAEVAGIPRPSGRHWPAAASPRTVAASRGGTTGGRPRRDDVALPRATAPCRPRRAWSSLRASTTSPPGGASVAGSGAGAPRIRDGRSRRSPRTRTRCAAPARPDAERSSTRRAPGQPGPDRRRPPERARGEPGPPAGRERVQGRRRPTPVASLRPGGDPRPREAFAGGEVPKPSSRPGLLSSMTGVTAGPRNQVSARRSKRASRAVPRRWRHRAWWLEAGPCPCDAAPRLLVVGAPGPGRVGRAGCDLAPDSQRHRQ